MLWEIISVLGIICLFYYIILCLAVRRWNATFSRFWIAAGVFFLYTGECRIVPLLVVTAIAGALFVAVELRIVCGMKSGRQDELSYLIVLGAQVRGNQITDSLMRRLERAEQYLKEHPDTVVIVSGGQGKGEEVTEASAMEYYLNSHGIEEERILREENSRTTNENLAFSSAYIKDMHMPVGIVTNNFHMYRACCYARKLGYTNIHAVPAGCKPVLFLNYMVREFFAVLKMWIQIDR